MRITVTVVFLMLFTLNCSGKDHRKPVDEIGYDLSAPSKTWKLPGSLKEVSGITFIDSVRLACVQDEKGIIYIFNTLSGKVENRFDVLPNGDYEGIAFDGNSYYMLRSDGIIFVVSDTIAEVEVNTGSENNEGLFFDKAGGRLLIATKKRSEDRSRHQRFIWSVRVPGYIPDGNPALVIDFMALGEFRRQSENKGKKQIEFNPSELAVHPKTSDIYLISSEDSAILVYTKDKQIKFAGRLNPGLMPQPEGIAFDRDGSMYISSEGVDGKASITMFKYYGKNR